MGQDTSPKNPDAGPRPDFWHGVRSRLEHRRQAPQISPRQSVEPAPLSFGQEWLWFVDRIRPGEAVQNMPQVLRFRGQLNIRAFERALQEIAARHEVLRTSIAVVDGAPRQIVVSESNFLLRVTDLRGVPEDRRAEAALQLARDEMLQPFNLAQNPLWRCRLLRMGEYEYDLVRTMHHIVFDAWSGSVFQRELTALYEAFAAGRPSPLPRIPIQYADFAAWQRSKATTGVDASLAYWKVVFADAPKTLTLPFDREYTSRPGHDGAWSSTELSPQIVQALSALSRDSGVSLYVTFLAAFQLLLFAHTGQRDMIICSPVSGRSNATRKLIGYFNNVIALRLSLSEKFTIGELLARTSSTLLEAQANEDLPFHRLIEIPTLASTPLNRAMFAMQNTPDRPDRMSDIIVNTVNNVSEAVDFDLFLSIRRIRPKLYANMQYRTELFDQNTIDSLLQGYGSVLDEFRYRPETRLGEVSASIACGT